jgi:hypothetical protein
MGHNECNLGVAHRRQGHHCGTVPPITLLSCSISWLPSPLVGVGSASTSGRSSWEKSGRWSCQSQVAVLSSISSKKVCPPPGTATVASDLAQPCMPSSRIPVGWHRTSPGGPLLVPNSSLPYNQPLWELRMQVHFIPTPNGVVQPLLWWSRFGKHIQHAWSLLPTRVAPSLTAISKLEASVTQHDDLAQAADIRETAIKNSSYNVAAVCWHRKGTTSTKVPVARFIRLQALHQRYHHYLPLVDHLLDTANAVSDDCS